MQADSESSRGYQSRLDRISGFIAEHFALVEPKLKAQVPHNPSAKHLLYAAARIAGQTEHALSILITNELPLQAIIVTRTFLEFMVRLRWASLHPDGWERYRCSEAHLFIQDVDKISKHYAEFRSDVSTDEAEQLIAEHDNVLCKYKDWVPRSIKNFLEQINVAEIEEGQRAPDSSFHLYQYDVTYGMLSASAHGRIVRIDGQQLKDARFALSAFAHAAIIMMLAFYKAAEMEYGPMLEEAHAMFKYADES